MTAPAGPKFNDIIDFMATVKFEREIKGESADFQRDYEQQLEMLRSALLLDHPKSDLSAIKNPTLGTQAAAAFAAFKAWYNGLS